MPLSDQANEVYHNVTDSISEQVIKPLEKQYDETQEAINNLVTEMQSLDLAKVTAEKKKELLQKKEEYAKKLAEIQESMKKIDVKNVSAEAKEKINEQMKALNEKVNTLSSSFSQNMDKLASGRGNFTGRIKEQRDLLRNADKRKDEAKRKNVTRWTVVGGGIVGGVTAIGRGISKGRNGLKNWWNGLRKKKEKSTDIWADYEIDEIKDLLKEKCPSEEQKINKLKSRKRVIAFAKKKKITPADELAAAA